MQATLEQMEATGLISESAEERDVVTLYERWQIPMYELEITPTIQTMEELREAQIRMLNNENGRLVRHGDKNSFNSSVGSMLVGFQHAR